MVPELRALGYLQVGRTALRALNYHQSFGYDHLSSPFICIKPGVAMEPMFYQNMCKLCALSQMSAKSACASILRQRANPGRISHGMPADRNLIYS